MYVSVRQEGNDLTINHMLSKNQGQKQVLVLFLKGDLNYMCWSSQAELYSMKIFLKNF